MSNPAFLVEGHLERIFIKGICPNSEVRKAISNGDHVALAVIAKQVASQCRLLHGKYWPIIVIFDREEREATTDEIAIELLNLIREESVKDEIIIAVADRAIENWIIADFETVKNYYPEAINTWGDCPDGKDGKAMIRKTVGRYNETTDGVDLMKKCNAHKMCASPSFAKLFNELSSIDCWWLRKE